ncbi:hypothetical protein Tco_1045527 [Tanacetum coccineum]|uniref:Uncharacterized protein n=1 Tax=Tanacetum coccineum TaxID=301880 RepID=A0ABQ5GV91_9ASTR
MMSKSAYQVQTPAKSAVQNTAGKGSKQAAEGDSEYLLEDKLWEICKKHYHQILPIMMEKVHKEKLQEIEEEWYAADRANRMQLARIKEAYFSEDEDNQDGYWKYWPKTSSHSSQNPKRNPGHGNGKIQSTAIHDRPCGEPEQKQVLQISQ